MSIDEVAISNIPSVKKRDISYRTVSSSKDQNEYQSEILGDVLDLFNKANKIEKSLNEALSIIDTENKHLQFKVNELQGMIAKLAQNYRNLTSPDPDAVKIITLYPDDITHDFNDPETVGAYIDLQNLDITMRPTQSLSKVGLYDEATDTTFLPSSLRVNIGPEDLKVGPNILSITDNNPLNAFNGDPTSYWIRKVTTDNSISEIRCEMIVTLPEDIITTRDINTIILHPYPVNSLDIMGIYYKSGGAWNEIESLSTHSSSVFEEYADIFDLTYERPAIEDAPNIKLNFKEIGANQLKIVFRQRHYLQELPTQRVFYLGAKNIQVLQNKYSKDYNTFDVTIDFPETGNIVLQDTEIVLNNPTEMAGSANLLQLDYFNIDSSNVTHKITDPIPFMLDSNKVLIKFKIYKGIVVPNIRAIKVKYKVT